MAIPEITDEAGWREWKVAPRKGLLSSEIAQLIGETPAAILAAIRTGQLRGVTLKDKGITFAYAATVDDIIAMYELSVEIADILRRRTQSDALDEVMYLGVPFHHVMGERIKVAIPTEFGDSQEFQRHNEGIAERC